MTAQGIASDAAPWLERTARAGFAVKGVLYLTIGVLSARAAIGAGGRAVTDTHGALGALRDVAGAPLLIVLALGLAGYGLWRLVDAITGTEHPGTDAKTLAIRIGVAARGLLHLALAGTAVSIALWQGNTGGKAAEARHWTARILDVPGGALLVGGVAIAIGAYGVYQIYCAVVTKLDEELELGSVSPGARRVIVAISRFGIASRGVVFCILGVQFARAAAHRDPKQAGDAGTSMQEVFVFGRWAFVVIATGVAAYGIYQLIAARYRRIRAR